MLRSVLAVLMGVVCAGVIVALVEVLGQVVFPLPAGINPHDPESLRAAMSQIPLGALLFVLLAWFLGTLAGAWLAARIANRANLVHAIIVGSALLAMGLLNLIMIPHPLWFSVVGIALFLPAAYAGALLARRAGPAAGVP